MRRILIHWLTTSVPSVLVVSLLTFVLVSFTPGDAARAVLGPNATEEQYQFVRTELGLNDPLWQQYWHWLSHALRGDLGRSILSGEPVVNVLAERLPVTGLLILGSVALTAMLGIGLGVLSAVRSGPLGRVIDGVSLLGLAVPNFWLGLILVAVFAVAYPLFPSTGYVPLSEAPTAWAASLVLPVVTLGLGACASIAKQTRDAMLDELGRPYVLMLRAHGLRERSVVLEHALKNAAIPVVTVLGLLFVGLLGGTVLVESVFVMPGLGSLAVQATVSHDLPVIQGVAVLFTIVVVVVNLIVEIMYGRLNPKAAL